MATASSAAPGVPSVESKWLDTSRAFSLAASLSDAGDTRTTMLVTLVYTLLKNENRNS